MGYAGRLWIINDNYMGIYMKKEAEIRKAVIPAAGFGTRFLPITKAQPKEMLPVVDKPVIQYVVEEAILSGIDDILIITGRNKRAIEDHFDSCFELESRFTDQEKNPFSEALNSLAEFPDIHFIRQRDQKGLGDAILHAERHCDNEPFAVLLGDTICISPKNINPCTRQMMDAYKQYHQSIIAVETVPENKLKDYGIIDGREIEEGIFEIQNIIEKPKPVDAPSNLGAIGRYILNPEIFQLLHEISPGYGGEIQLTDALRKLDKPLGLITNCRRFDIGDKIGWMKSSIELTLEREEFAKDLRPFLSQLLKSDQP
jgi:UTP--glucose-1-phosphate uridylyltransferase